MLSQRGTYAIDKRAHLAVIFEQLLFDWLDNTATFYVNLRVSVHHDLGDRLVVEIGLQDAVPEELTQDGIRYLLDLVCIRRSAQEPHRLVDDVVDYLARLVRRR